MKKKSFLFALVVFFCFILLGCKTKDVVRHRIILDFCLYSSDGSWVYPYGPTPTDGIYVLEEFQTYELSIDFAMPMALFPDSIGMEYDNTIFEIECLVAPDSPDYDPISGYSELYYRMTCLKKCESTLFAVYPQGAHSDVDDPCHSEFIFRVE